MKRNIIKDLKNWKNSKYRRPLLLKGARQVGKTFILNSFGKEEFPQVHYFNFETEKKLAAVFDQDLKPRRIVVDLGIISGQEINIETDLLIFDEIQNCPLALTSLKYFCEDLPQLHLACAGSHMGVLFMEGSFPVGKVDELQLFPMNFEEFLINSRPKSFEVFQRSKETLSLTPFEHDLLWAHLREFFIVGGLPRSVKLYIENDKNFQLCRNYQLSLVGQYFNDFHKHAGKMNALQILEVFKSIPKQLSQWDDSQTKRYIFKEVLPGKKGFREISGPIEWLTSSSLAQKINIVNRAEIPLLGFCKPNIFKLFSFDIGILGAMLELDINSLLDQNYGIIKGYFAENFVALELICSGERELISWGENQAEIEFLLTGKNGIVPLEVKSGKITRAKSLSSYISRYHPKIAIKVSAQNFNISPDQIIQNIPLYSVGNAVKKLIYS